ncbi:hypothetical protein SISNIDRAFT_409381 [Sistotremastrum niveocremeum HHB9708]|uniref:Uncharacterized protein n=1 Tax=Sistotremastrum niveocremeum HHB9708 TaxID=1314777 RepID=A0A164W8L9_9AGAM|nr:hypothetical protein SISNIDRAFT_409381 [Sistotremastrum niveocremeum HHB9708]
MHLPCLNFPDLFVALWKGQKGSIACERPDRYEDWPWICFKGDAWTAHGLTVEAAKEYLPGSFDRTPRNPVLKLNSGYKAWEYLIWFFGMGPCLFYRLLLEPYWSHYCLAVRAFRLCMQESITPQEVTEAIQCMTKFVEDFEHIYSQQKVERIHFCRPFLHTSAHVPWEIPALGPLMMYAQWTMERTIGNLGREIRQHSNAFANLSQRALLRCQVNALKALIPDLDPLEAKLPKGGKRLQDGYALLPKRAKKSTFANHAELTAINEYAMLQGSIYRWTSFRIRKWARLALPSGQVARSIWKEVDLRTEKSKQYRRSRNLSNQYVEDGFMKLAEVKYYFELTWPREQEPVVLAMVSTYGPRDEQLYSESWKTYDSRILFQNHRIIEANSIQSVVAMIPDTQYSEGGVASNRWFLVEKPGLKMGVMTGVTEDLRGDRDDQAD